MDQDKLFDGNQLISPLSVALFAAGIFMLAGLPPVGLVMIAVAVSNQARFCYARRPKRVADTAAIREAQRKEREYFAAIKTLSS